METPKHPELVGVEEIADRLDTRRATVQQWISREVIPPARWYISGPVWDWEADIMPWAIKTRRIPHAMLFSMLNKNAQDILERDTVNSLQAKQVRLRKKSNA